MNKPNTQRWIMATLFLSAASAYAGEPPGTGAVLILGGGLAWFVWCSILGVPVFYFFRRKREQ